VPVNATAIEIQDNTDITKMVCMGPMCISDLKEKIIGIAVAYTEAKEITNIGFVLPQVK
jgi:hypothetical protein